MDKSEHLQIDDTPDKSVDPARVKNIVLTAYRLIGDELHGLLASSDWRLSRPCTWGDGGSRAYGLHCRWILSRGGDMPENDVGAVTDFTAQLDAKYCSFRMSHSPAESAETPLAVDG